MTTGGMGGSGGAGGGTTASSTGGATTSSTSGTTASGTGGTMGCVDAKSCPGADTECASRTCKAGMCGVDFAASGTVLLAQTVGDCKVAVCDGAGATTTANSAMDPFDDMNPCTDDLCMAGSLLNLPTVMGAPCANATNGKFCDGNGACVECITGSDCASQLCQLNKCVAASCLDTVLNGMETDVDCGGGGTCAKCTTNKLCLVGSDCADGICTGNHCAAPLCNDVSKNGTETDVDCGGVDGCPTCVAGKSCKAGTDCKGGQCTGSVCLATCTDSTKNGTETDVDCGGGACPGCGPAHTCKVSGDCKGASCINFTCAPSCTDGVQNPGTAETDVDCGGGTCAPCANNLKCAVALDCLSKNCDPVAKTCIPATCNDGIQNLNETDIDCGGGTCGQCSPGQKCSVAANCVIQICTASKCACPAGMKIIPKAGGGTYCIDTSEVTASEYDVFLSAGQVIQNLPTVCAYKLNLPGYVPGQWPPSPTQLGLPVANVDWCDAYAYCAYSNKHLCGKIGGGPNVDPLNTVYADTTKSEWFNACSATGNNDYPYSDIYNHATCRGVDQASVGAVAGACPSAANPNPANACLGVISAASGGLYTSCQGGVIGLYAMSGNLAEWENSCDDAANPTTCHVRGGSHCEAGGVGGALRCDELASKPITYQDCDVGFRCCQ